MGCPWQPYSLGGEGTASEATSTISAWFRPSASARQGPECPRKAKQIKQSKSKQSRAKQSKGPQGNM